jgi:serine/threonine protein kinase
LKEHLDLGRWPEADDLLDRALALPPEEREAFVRRATAHDRALGYALASIVREAGRDDGFLEPGGALTGDFGAEVGRALDLQRRPCIIPWRLIEHYEVIELSARRHGRGLSRARPPHQPRRALVLLPQFADDPDRLARFRREAQVLAAINHPGIASIYGLAEQDSLRALVLEYVDGVTLAERLESGAMSVTESVAIARQLAEAIEAAHEAGVIHRDLKPANIILLRTSSDRVGQGAGPSLKVLDFGLGKALVPLQHNTALQGLTGTSPGILLGTAAYMSPEQARAEVVDERADIWAFGCVLFEMLTGTRAFPGRTAAEVLGNIVEREPAFSLLPENTPASIRRLLRRSLEKQLPRRLSCMRDAILELDDATLPALEPVWRPPSVAAFAAAIVAIGIVAALVLQVMRRPEPVPQPVARFAVPLPPGDRPAIGLQPVLAHARWATLYERSAAMRPRSSGATWPRSSPLIADRGRHVAVFHRWRRSLRGRRKPADFTWRGPARRLHRHR